jgi:hypothetical protein
MRSNNISTYKKYKPKDLTNYLGIDYHDLSAYNAQLV